MSRQSTSSPRPPPGRDRPPAPIPNDADDGPPPVPKPRAGPRVGGGRRGGNLPAWPPPGYTGNQSSPSPSLPSRTGGGGGDQQQRAPPPLPPTQSPAASPGPPHSHSRSPAPPPPSHQPPQLPPPRASLSPSISSPPPPSPPHNRVAPTPAGSGGDGKSGFAFGTCLQEAHDAINKRHEEELHALESFRAHVFFRAKADREYAQELAKINSRANKTLSTVSQSSAIVQVSFKHRQVCSCNAIFTSHTW